MSLAADGKWLLVAEAGINAVGVVDVATRQVIGHIPAGWFPTRVQVSKNEVFVANAKGQGTGPNSTPATRQANGRRGSVSRFALPPRSELEALTASVMANDGFGPVAPVHAPPPVRYVVIIVKENRTYDEVFGDLPGAQRRRLPGAMGPEGDAESPRPGGRNGASATTSTPIRKSAWTGITGWWAPIRMRGPRAS